jgi:hypothetical protein
VPKSYVQELERTAREAAQQRAAATAAITGAPAATTPIIDPKLRDMLERQNREISRESGFNPAVTTASQPYYFPRRGLSPDAEAKARQILEQEQGLIPTPSSSAANAPAAPAASTAPAMTAPAEPAAPAPAVAPAITASTPSASASAAMAPSGTIAPDDSQVRYSKELEERARQILLQRAQNQSTAAAHAAPAPASPVPPTQPSAPEMRPAGSAASAASVAPATQAPASPASGVAAAKAASEAQADEIHARALETLNQIESGKAPQPAAAGPMSKQERLRAITDLYKADKMSPAEYHRQRAAIIASPN